ncbi:MAG: KpsF/GutQ family sugar-phosphate isomerase [Planctomycetes bacterium]|nr:KpsF/GutQ family sugar-phosphate isomerase [Planctomycetota bacterium]
MSDTLEFGKEVLLREGQAVSALAALLDARFEQAVQLVLKCTGHTVITGIGKPWLIGQKISATMASTGTRSFPLHPSEAMHGDVGRLHSDDVVIAMSNSGESEEVVRLLPVIKRVGCKLIGITAKPQSALARHSDVVLEMGKFEEACPIGMAPSVSTTVMLALGDALALAVMKARNFSREDYARFHPGGALGRSLMKVSEIMRGLKETATVDHKATVKDALSAITKQKTGAVFIVDGKKLLGVFTDGDLRRHIEDDGLLKHKVTEIMTMPGKRIEGEHLASEAVKLVQEFRIGELPVVNAQGELLGHVALKDLVSMHFM